MDNEENSKDLKTFCEEFKIELLEVQNYITDPCGEFEKFCKKWDLPYTEEC